MPVEFRRNSRWWYGRYQVDGKRHSCKLNVEVTGIRPCPEQPEGNREFLISRGKAEEELRQRVKKAREKRNAEEYVQELHELRTGRRIESLPLVDLAKAWDAAPRRKRGSARYVKQAHAVMNAFVSFVAKRFPNAETLADVTPDTAEAFMQAERKRGVGGRTWNSKLIMLRSAFRAVATRANVVRNPFEGIVTMEEETAHRRPFSPEELRAILAAAERDPFAGPIMVTGMCTAMRLGDCCRLKWSDVDLEAGFVRVKTSKTGETVEIPMLPRLRELLDATPRSKAKFVFAEQAGMYTANAQGMSYRVRRVFEQAGFYDEKASKKKDASKVDRADRIREALAKFDELPADTMTPEKRRRMRQALELCAQGLDGAAAGRELGLGKSTVSGYLRELQGLTSVTLAGREGKASRRKHIGDVHAKRAHGIRRASIRDFHSFRVTWITLALAAGVPLELVQRVTGHRTTQVVLKHYFRPGREDFKERITGAMPRLLAEPAGARTIDVATEESEAGEDGTDASQALSEALELLKGVTGKANHERVAKAAALIQKAKRCCEQPSPTPVTA